MSISLEPLTKCRKVGAYCTPLLLTCTSLSSCQTYHFLLLPFLLLFTLLAVSFLSFFSLPLFSSNRILRISSCYSTSSDQSLWFYSFKSSLFQRAIAVGGRVNRNLNQCFSTAGPLCTLHPSITSGEGGGGERGGGLSNTHHTWKSPHSNREKSRALTER